ncbi:MAG: Gfo/Idh/MocA family oxidoreductase [Anaerolineales bacterium]|nr:Gfo/Idh/MocA family oxidoreductase [Anaerolineales bacterium]
MLRWGILGPGSIARVFCNGLRFTDSGQAVAVASRDRARAEALAGPFGIPNVYDSYDALLADPDVDAVYVANIHPAHLEWVVKAAEAGKHILVEKPIGLNRPEAAQMIAAAEQHDVFLMEAFMYRCHPQIARTTELIASGAIGQVRLIRSAFGYNAGSNYDGRALNQSLGGGGILDVGCYPISAARWLAGAAQGQPFADPTSFKAHGVLAPTGVDHYTAATMAFPGDIIAEVSTAVGCNIPGEVTVFGSEGTLSIDNPWLPSSPCRSAREPLPPETTFPAATIQLTRGGNRETITVPADRDLFTYEADMVANHIAARQAPAMSWADTLGNMGALDQWRAEIGVRYAQDG